MKEYIIVGAGLTGAVVARCLADAGHSVLVLERRGHIAGNLYDEYCDLGFLVQRYGPHVFHTNSERAYEFIKKYGEWDDYFLECSVYMKGKFTPSPFNFQTADDYFELGKAEAIKAALRAQYGGRERVSVTELLESSDSSVKEFADFLFDSDYKPYTAKQWGVSPSEIDASVLKRVPVLLSYETGYFTDRYQCLPRGGYTRFIKRLLSHKNIKIKLKTDALPLISIKDGSVFFRGKKPTGALVYTGAADELLATKYGALPYRSLRFKYETHACQSYQKSAVVAYPEEKDYTRITEYTKLPRQNTANGTIIAKEYPEPYSHGSEPYYPIPTEKSAALYEKYRCELEKIPNLILCGRLADFKYYNMDAALLRALEIADGILKK